MITRPEESQVHTFNQRQIPLADEQNPGAGDFQHLGQLFRLGPEVQGDVYGVQQGRGKVELNILVGVHLHGGHPITRFHAQVRQAVCQAVYPFLQLAVGERLLLEQERGTVGHDGAGDK